MPKAQAEGILWKEGECKNLIVYVRSITNNRELQILPITFFHQPFGRLYVFAFLFFAHLPILPSAFCLLPFTFGLPPSAFYLLPSAFCLLPSAIKTAYIYPLLVVGLRQGQKQVPRKAAQDNLPCEAGGYAWRLRSTAESPPGAIKIIFFVLYC